MVKYKAILIDLDGTLANCEHRRVKATRDDGSMDWDDFFQGMENDGLNDWCHKLMQNMQMCAHMIIVSGRSEAHRKVTEAWLKKHNIRYDALHMRPEKDRRPDTEVKLEIYQQKIKPQFDVVFAVDDRKCVVDMWRTEGLVCLDCAGGTF